MQFKKMDGLEKIILLAIQEKEIFIGYYMLCRYIHGKGYIRYGCNAGYKKPDTNGKCRLYPCKVLCGGTHVYYQRVRYFCLKLAKLNKVFLMKVRYKDAKNPNSTTTPHRTSDQFVIISRKRFNKKV